MSQCFSRSAVWLLVSLCSALALNAAEIELHREVRAQRSLVRLGDVAVIGSADPVLAQRLSEVELFPAPPAAGWIALDQRDLLELLEIRGFDPVALRLTGAEQTMIHGRDHVVYNREPSQLPAEAAAVASAASAARPAVLRSEPRTKPAGPQTMAAAESRLAEAIVDYLRRMAGGNYDWQVQPRIDPQEAALFTAGGLEIDGGSQPWTGRQSFAVRVHRADGVVARSVAADVSLPAQVVAAARNLAAGDVLQAADLQLVVPTSTAASRQTLERIDEVVGMEVTRSLPAGQALESDMLRRPILVKRSAVATLHVRAGGVVVGTKVRAMDDGAMGEMIRVQSLFDRQQYMATVVGAQQVEMLAGSATY